MYDGSLNHKGNLLFIVSLLQRPHIARIADCLIKWIGRGRPNIYETI